MQPPQLLAGLFQVVVLPDQLDVVLSHHLQLLFQLTMLAPQTAVQRTEEIPQQVPSDRWHCQSWLKSTIHGLFLALGGCCSVFELYVWIQTLCISALCENTVLWYLKPICQGAGISKMPITSFQELKVMFSSCLFVNDQQLTKPNC